MATRIEKIKKLGNKIKRFTGLKNRETGKWLYAPQPHLAAELTGDLLALNVKQPSEELLKIKSFTRIEEFDEYMRNFV